MEIPNSLGRQVERVRLPNGGEKCISGSPNRMNFRKSAKGGVGVIFNPKIQIADFANFKQGFLIMKLTQNSSFRVYVIFNNCIALKLYYTFIWKSCACISYYTALISPHIYATISVIKKIAI